MAGVSIPEGLQLIPPTITERHRLQLQAIGKMAKVEDKPKIWTTMEGSQTLGEHKVHRDWARVFFAVSMAFTLCHKVVNIAVL